MQDCLDGKAEEKDLDELIGRIKDSGAIQKAMSEARVSTEKAIKLLDGFPNGKDKSYLIELARYIVDRDL